MQALTCDLALEGNIHIWSGGGVRDLSRLQRTDVKWMCGVRACLELLPSALTVVLAVLCMALVLASGLGLLCQVCTFKRIVGLLLPVVSVVLIGLTSNFLFSWLHIICNQSYSKDRRTLSTLSSHSQNQVAPADGQDAKSFVQSSQIVKMQHLLYSLNVHATGVPTLLLATTKLFGT